MNETQQINPQCQRYNTDFYLSIYSQTCGRRKNEQQTESRTVPCFYNKFVSIFYGR